VGAASGVSDAVDILQEEAKELGFHIRKFYRYVIDHNEIPRGKVVMKIPYL